MRRRIGANERMSYGPFPVKVGSLVGGIGCVLVALTLLVWALQVTRIHCERAGSVTCTVQRFRFAGRSPPFQLARVSSTRAVRVNKGHTSEVGTLVLQDTDEKEHRSMEVSYDQLVRHEGNVRAFLSEPNRAVFDEDMQRTPAVLLVLSLFGLLMLAIGCLCVRDALRGSLSAALRLVDGGRGLQVTRTFWAVPLRSQVIELSGVTAVELEWRLLPPPFLSTARDVPEHGGRLLIHTEHGPLPVLDEVARGRNVHRMAAIRLRDLLGLPPGQTQPAPALPASYIWHRGFRRFAACWLGLTTGSLAGMGVGAVLALTIGGAKGSDLAGGPFYLGGLALGALGGVAVALHLTSEAWLQR